MDKKLGFVLGSISIVVGAIALSFEFYGLKVFKYLELAQGSSKTYAIDYINDPEVFIAMLLSTAVIIFGLSILIISLECFKKNQKQE